MQNTIYTIEPSNYMLFLPFGVATGIILQIMAAFLKNKALLLAGLAMAVICAVFEKDITFITGDILAATALWLCLFRNKKS